MARSYDEASTVPVYLQYVQLVSGAPANGNELTGPISASTNITLPASGTYLGDELILTLNGSYLEPGFDYNYVGTGTRTQVSMTFDLVVGDRLDFKKYRN